MIHWIGGEILNYSSLNFMIYPPAVEHFAPEKWPSYPLGSRIVFQLPTNHHFSGENSLLNFGWVMIFWWPKHHQSQEQHPQAKDHWYKVLEASSLGEKVSAIQNPNSFDCIGCLVFRTSGGTLKLNHVYTVFMRKRYFLKPIVTNFHPLDWTYLHFFFQLPA